MIKKTVDLLKENLNEFKDFAFKGNLIQLAIGVVLGGAFGKLITSFVDNIFMPLISVFSANQDIKDAGFTHWQFRGIKFGQFLGDFVSFVIIALAIFILIVKVVGWIVSLTRKAQGPALPAEPTDKECPYCLMKIPIKARKCGYCTSVLEPGMVPA